MASLSRIINDEQMQKITSQFTRLGEKSYLENAGTTLYPQCLLEPVTQDLMTNLYMNPHSDKSTRDCIEQIRCMILRHFNTDTSNYSVVFTSGCTQSLKLVVESFQFAGNTDEEANGNFVYLNDNHTSVLGLREIAVQKDADIVHISHNDFLSACQQKHVKSWKDKEKKDGNSLFVYPAQSNFNGYKYPIDCVENIKDGCLNSCVKKSLCQIYNNWYILLDAASFVPSSKLDLTRVQPDFVTLSFYKIFGYPTGLGALLIKNGSENVLSDKKYFGGGTVDVVLCGEDFHMKRKNISERFEDGTASFLSIIALKHCFDTMHKLIPKVINNDLMTTISHHTFYLAKDLYQQLSELTHKNGQKAIILYMDSDFSDIRYQGATVTFNLLRENGSYVGYAEVTCHKTSTTEYRPPSWISMRGSCHTHHAWQAQYGMLIHGNTLLSIFRREPLAGSYCIHGHENFKFQHMADLFNITVRTGCFCNTGTCQRHLRATNKEIKDMYKAGHKCGDEIDLIDGKPTGAVRVSFGYFNTFLDVDKLVFMISRCFVETEVKRPRRLFIDVGKTTKKLPNGNVENIVTYDANRPCKINGYLMKNEHTQDDLDNDSDKSSLDSGIELKEIAIFPIKSCGAFKVKRGWTIGPKGFLLDREWMIIKENGLCLTQKQNSRMCMIQPTIDLKLNTLTLHFKGKTSISIPLNQDSQKISESSLCHSRICTDLVKGYDCGDAVADWISEALEVSYLRLIKQSSNDGRTVKKTNESEQKLLSLSNQAQYLLVNTATVRWLRDKIKDPYFGDDIGMLVDRFRGNLIIDMETELEERNWNKVIIGNHLFQVEGQCNRCQMVCIDQQTGEKTIEPLRTISEQFAGKLRFGIYLSYAGTTDQSDDRFLETNISIKAILNDDIVS